MTAMIHSQGGLVFVWRGGAYIDIYAEQAFELWMTKHGAATPYEIINVWNYAQDRANIQSLEEFAQECEFWMQRREHEIWDEVDKEMLAS